MFKLLTDVILHLRLKKKLKSFNAEPKHQVKVFKTMAIIIPEDCLVDEGVFVALSKILNISTNRVTILMFSKKKKLKKKSTFKNVIYCTRKQLTFFGDFPLETRAVFKKKFDLLVNYFSEQSVFPELISINFNSKLRIGFLEANHQINDIVLDLKLDQTDLFLNESEKYLNSTLKQ